MDTHIRPYNPTPLYQHIHFSKDYYIFPFFLFLK